MGEIQYLIRLEELGADSASDDGPSSMATYRYCTYDDVPLRLPVGLATTTVLPSTYDFVMGGASPPRGGDCQTRPCRPIPISTVAAPAR